MATELITGQRRSNRLLLGECCKPTLDGLNLEAAGVNYLDKGGQVNDPLQILTGMINAAGDVLGGRQFSIQAFSYWRQKWLLNTRSQVVGARSFERLPDSHGK